jgi:pimeloyl-ACP methyl ester carboxylesterase
VNISTRTTVRQPVEHFVRHEGKKLRFLTVGEGPPLLLAHGWNGSAENFDTWYDDLGALRTLVIPDLPGFGESERLDRRHDALALSRALDTVVQEIGAKKVDLGGLCFGACVALDFARRRPEMVDKLIVHTPLIEPELTMARFRLQIKVLTSRPLFYLIAWAARQRRISDWYKRHFTEGVVEKDTGSDVNFINQQRCYAPASRDWAHSAIRSHDSALLHAWANPLLILLAADDKVADIDGIATMSAELKHASVAILENAGHGWSEDFVRRQNSVLTAFLRDEEPPASAQLRSLHGAAV